MRPCSVDEAITLAFEPEAFDARFGLRLAPGWVVPGALDTTVDALEAGVDPAWLTHLLLERDAVIGMGGFTGPPRDGEVEIGYRVAPAHRGRGIATTAVGTWVARARAAGLARVVARTHPGPGASATVLGRSGFARDPGRDDGCWWWRLELT